VSESNASRRGLLWRTSAVGLALAAAFALAGCAQEGKLIESDLPALGVAWNGTFLSRIQSVTNTGDTIYTVTSTVRFKIPVHAANPCEALRSLIEIRADGPLTNTTLIMTPLARYNADDACVAQGSTATDTTLTLAVVGVSVINGNVKQFRVATTNGPLIFANFDSVTHAPVLASARFQIRVEDQATGAVIPGAAVQVDKMTAGVPSPLGSGTTDAFGMFAFDTPCADSLGTESLPYRVTTTLGTRQSVLSMVSAPARCQMRENVVVRLE
jgi:hypothetical protein